jgi:hypothetical protein
MKSSNLSIIVESTPGLTPEEACDLRATALRYALDRYFEKQKAAKTSGGEKGSGKRRAPSKRDTDRRQ